MSFDVERARRRFPALHQGWTLMDNACGAAVLDSVIERMGEYMRTTPVQPAPATASRNRPWRGWNRLPLKPLH